MGHFCTICQRTWPTRSGFFDHLRRIHRSSKPDVNVVYEYHPQLNARPCDCDGHFLDEGTPPPPRPIPPQNDWSPFENRPAFQFAEFAFEKCHTSAQDINELLRMWQAYNILKGDDSTMYDSLNDVLSTIDNIPLGDLPWSSFNVRYTGPIDEDSPSWKRHVYTVHTRNTFAVQANFLKNQDFARAFDRVPFRAYAQNGSRQWSNLMSGQWAWKQADEIAKDPNTHGSMFCPVILGSDKTTVSVATGHREFHPVYMSLGNLHNNMRRGHCDAVVPVAFLAIPKVARQEEDNDDFRTFRKQLYHASITQILEPLRHGMTVPHVLMCPDGHFRRTIFEIGPFIADYPEQVFLAGIVSRWCPKCFAKNLTQCGHPRFRAFTEYLLLMEEDEILWSAFGIDPGITTFTSNFPRADIHELLSPDLLHQVIKGTFKDHLVTWIERYIAKTHSKANAKRIMDDIDRRIAIVPNFPGLRRFPEGRHFKQWTGNDSKALMKVIIPAIVGHVPSDMVRCLVAFMDFCYLARRPSHTLEDLTRMQDSLQRFHQLRLVFVTHGIHTDEFCLPRQHSLSHYIPSIKLFGSPNGLCSSITESKHITAVKKPWRASSRNNSLKHILDTNVRMSKISAARIDFGHRGMLRGDVLTAARIEVGDIDDDDEVPMEVDYERRHHLQDDDEDDVQGEDGPECDVITSLAARPVKSILLDELGEELGCPHFIELCRRFLFSQVYDLGINPDRIDLDDCPMPETHVQVFTSASSVFYAPNEQ
ncbi:hypothetical protein NLI96_g12658 [Meripilus lineatus]|uniref:C2H2-type domain-containing protein n=1 Tax=Meripilus lineatus TaxID=2056292 RepID=A0AAD5UPH6_9APHY|nr:hypothetical protein NLI96_g12658 [Physisporinus lineatus]